MDHSSRSSIDARGSGDSGPPIAAKQDPNRQNTGNKQQEPTARIEAPHSEWHPIRKSRHADRIRHTYHLATQNQGAASSDGIIQQGMTRLTGQGMAYARAATRCVASDRMPICMTAKDRGSPAEPMRESKEDKAREEITIWSLNVRGMSGEARLKELEQEAQ